MNSAIEEQILNDDEALRNWNSQFILLLSIRSRFAFNHHLQCDWPVPLPVQTLSLITSIRITNNFPSMFDIKVILFQSYFFIKYIVTAPKGEKQRNDRNELLW